MSSSFAIPIQQIYTHIIRDFELIAEFPTDGLFYTTGMSLNAKGGVSLTKNLYRPPAMVIFRGHQKFVSQTKNALWLFAESNMLVANFQYTAQISV